MTMEYKTLRGTDLKVSTIGVGCNKIAAPMSEDQRHVVETTLHQAIESGINFFDTADAYGNGAADRLLRNILASQRDKLVVCSKSGLPERHNTRRWQRKIRMIASQLTPGGRAARTISRIAAGPTFAPAYIEKAIEASLSRLGIDYLDLFLLHNPFQVVLWRDELFEALDRLKRQGKIRYYGASLDSNRASTEDWLAWPAIPGISAIQVLVNPLRSVDLSRLVPAARNHDVGIIARQPFHKGAVFTNQKFLKLAANSRYTPAQLAVRFALEQNGVDMVLAGFRSPAHLEENLGALAGPGPSQRELERLQSLTEVF